MLRGLTVLLLCQLAGEALVTATGLRLPGAVAGMLLLLGWLAWHRPPEDAGTVRAADALLRHLQLFFVPAGVGVVAHLSLLRSESVPVLASLVVSWLLGLLTVGWLAAGLARGRPDGADGTDGADGADGADGTGGTGARRA